ncbi:cysteine--tRNA ligase [Patescibacteria group bacterium]|nr:cysteine--tRNA ligase [Patescibacteria group bacterium]MBP9710302.1 cysteine--tRNA ligase [Patescibacteria group bacterium]
MLQLWNTLHKKLEEFVPLQPGKVGFYACGPTVYNPLQLGNWRKYIVDDTFHRSFLFLGYEVTHVTNITDVGHLVGDTSDGEDKVEREAAKTGKTAWDIARLYEASFVEGLKHLNVLPPTVMPRATEHIAEQIALVEELERKGFTYTISDGVYFDTVKFANYGVLSGQTLDEKEAGARVEVNQEKRQPSDFALWKFSPADQKRQMEWSSPWGVGFPGWHIECSAMAAKYLGQPFDLHSGGIDHIPVHHENEIAQSEAAYDKPLANYWVHNEFLLVDGGRMGKSMGNAYTLEDLAPKGFEAMDFRYFCLGAHYRSKLNFTWEALEGARNALQKLKRRFLEWESTSAQPEQRILDEVKAALENDFAMPTVLAWVWDVVGHEEMSSATKRATLLAVDEVLGLGMKEWKREEEVVPAQILELQRQRDEARANKDWQASDRLRDEIRVHGWVIEDGAQGSVVRKA